MYRILVLLISLTVLLCATPARSATPDSSYASYMQQCDDYIRHYQPQYIKGLDEPYIPHVPDSLNEWLIARAAAHDYAPLKYACALILLQNQELLSALKSDRMMSNGMLQERNGFIVLLREAMGRGQVGDSIKGAEYLPFETGDLCSWIRHNKKKIPDYEYLQPFLERR